MFANVFNVPVELYLFLNIQNQDQAGHFPYLSLLLIAGLGLHKFRVHTIRMRAFDFLAEMDRLKQAGELDLDENAGPKVPREIKRGHIFFYMR